MIARTSPRLFIEAIDLLKARFGGSTCGADPVVMVSTQPARWPRRALVVLDDDDDTGQQPNYQVLPPSRAPPGKVLLTWVGRWLADHFRL